MTDSADNRLQARNDLAWAIAIGGIGIVLFAALLLFAWQFAATLFLLFAGMLLGVGLNAMTTLLGRLTASRAKHDELEKDEEVLCGFLKKSTGPWSIAWWADAVRSTVRRARSPGVAGARSR